MVVPSQPPRLPPPRGALCQCMWTCVQCCAPSKWICCFPQEPGNNQEIKEFAAGYNVKFDMYSKICVNGDDAHPLWKWMKVQPKGRGMLGK